MSRLQFLTGIFILCLLFDCSYGFSQNAGNSCKNIDIDLFKQGEILFQEKNYAASREILSEFLSTPHIYSEQEILAEYYMAMSALYLRNHDAEILLSKFVQDHPEKSLSQKIFFHLGDFLFDNRKYNNAIKNFQQTDTSLLNDQEKERFYFKNGYSHFIRRKHKEAQTFFQHIIDHPTDYGKKAAYYSAHISYEQKDYVTALQLFSKLKGDKTYENLVSYYLVQIYYYQNQQEKLLQEALPLMSTIHKDRKPELAILIGQAYYQLSDYTLAIPYFEIYENNTKKRIPRTTRYAMAFSNFQVAQYEKAIEHFQLAIANKKDTLAQNAYYHLGMCFFNTKQPIFAANAFYSAYSIDTNPVIREDALYNYVKLSYENPSNTYNKTADVVKNFLNEFPHSTHNDEIKELLVDIFLTSKDYMSAINAFNEIKNKTIPLQHAYQKITFLKAVEYYQENDFTNAIALFNESLQYKFDNNIVLNTLFWLGDSYLQAGNYSSSATTYNTFLSSHGAYSLKEYPTAYYNLGYIHFSEKNYSLAIDFFRKYTIGTNNRHANLMGDAHIRIGDINFIDKDYDQAIIHYKKSIELNAPDSDYALFQQAMAYGGKGEYSKKISTLQTLLNQFKNSAFSDDAEYENGLTYLIEERFTESLECFKRVYTNYPYSPLTQNAYLKTGLIYYTLDNPKESIAILKQVIEKYPNTSASREALSSIKNIYIDLNKADEYFDFANSLNYKSVTDSEKDSINYITAENLYMKGKCKESSSAFNKYLTENPQGYFVLNAHFYIAECAYRANNKKMALHHYQIVIEQPNNQFLETALSKVSSILYQENRYEEALNAFQQLAAVAELPANKIISAEGIMQCHYNLKDYSKAASSAKALLADKRISPNKKSNAELILARSAFISKELKLAETTYKSLAKSPNKTIAAEANYYLAYILYTDNQYTKSENLIFEISEKYASEDLWLAKSFILLSDVYMQTGNLFQAKQTLQSIIDNYKGDTLVKEAQIKKDAIEKIEKAEESKKIEIETKAKEDEENIEKY